MCPLGRGGQAIAPTPQRRWTRAPWGARALGEGSTRGWVLEGEIDAEGQVGSDVLDAFRSVVFGSHADQEAPIGGAMTDLQQGTSLERHEVVVPHADCFHAQAQSEFLLRSEAQNLPLEGHPSPVRSIP